MPDPEISTTTTNEPGATAGDHPLRATVSTAVAVAAVPATYPRPRAGLGTKAAHVLSAGRARPSLTASN